MAHIRRRKNGSWEALAYIGRDERGRRRYASKSFRRKREAEQWAAKQHVAVSERRLLPVAPTTLADWLARWLADQRVNVAAKTLEQREMIVRLYLTPTLGAAPLAKLTPAMIQAAYTRIGEQVGPATVGHAHAVLRAALNTARRLGLLAVNPALDATPPRAPRPTQPHVSADNLRRLIDIADTEGEQWGALVYLLASTGLRRGEALGARWADLDADAGTLRVTQALLYVNGQPTITTPKTPTSRRMIYLDGEAVRRLQRHRAAQAERRLRSGAWPDPELIFASGAGTPLNDGNLNRAWHRITKRAGVRLTLHGLRHVFATRALSEGVAVAAVAAQLGHSSPAVTYSRYAHAVPADQRRAVEAVSRVLAQR